METLEPEMYIKWCYRLSPVPPPAAGPTPIVTLEPEMYIKLCYRLSPVPPPAAGPTPMETLEPEMTSSTIETMKQMKTEEIGE